MRMFSVMVSLFSIVMVSCVSGNAGISPVEGMRKACDEGNAERAMAAYASVQASDGDKIDASDFGRLIVLVSQEYPLETLALIEKARSLYPYAKEISLIESGIRERLGDYEGAVFCAWEALSYDHAKGNIDESQLNDGIEALGEYAKKVPEGPQKEAIIHCITAISALKDERYDACRASLNSLRPLGERVKNISACVFETWTNDLVALNTGSQDALQACLEDAKYVRWHPEYWYRILEHLVKFQKNDLEDSTLRVAEYCVMTAVNGPHAMEARSVLAGAYGLEMDASPSLLVKSEIETVAVATSIAGDASLLDKLFPLLGLPDNPYTLYAVGVVKGMAGDDGVNVWLKEEAQKASGRLKERLRYCVGGSL